MTIKDAIIKEIKTLREDDLRYLKMLLKQIEKRKPRKFETRTLGLIKKVSRKKLYDEYLSNRY